MVPPDKEMIEDLDQVLRIPFAHAKFWSFLEQMDEIQGGESLIDRNNFRLLSLYTDIRFFDNDIRQIELKSELSKTGKTGSFSRNSGT